MDSTRQNSPFKQGTPSGPLAKVAAFLLSATFLVLALAVVAVVGVALGGWLWWKTRAMRKQMKEMREAAQQMGDGGPMPNDQVIEGEFIREVPPAQRLR